MRLPSSLPPCLAALLAAALLPGCGGTTETPCSGATLTFTASAAWQAIGPSQWANACAIEVKAPALAADERLAVLLVNGAGTDRAATTLSASGVLAIGEAPGPRATALVAEAAAPASRDDGSPIAIQQASLARWLSGPAPAEARRARGAVRAAAAAVPATRSFCTYVLPAFTTWTRKSATLVHESASAAYYATDDVKAGLADLVAGMPATSAGFWERLDSYYEGIVDAEINPAGARNIRGALEGAFGGASDHDGNGKMIFLFTDLSARSGTGGTSFVAGYFDPNDLQAADATADCSASGAGQGSNGADMLYLMDPVHYVSMGYALDTVVNSELPSVMAHELQHDALFNARCVRSGVTARCSASGDPAATGDLWLNEGLSMVAEDVAGFGMNTASGRSRVAAYLSCAASNHTCHETASLTAWPTPGDPYGNYGAVHAFLRWHLDQRAKVSAGAALAFTQALSGATVTARDAVAAASGLSFEEGSARFASAALFSGWSADPAPAFAFAADQAWSPLHTRVAWPSHHLLGAAPVSLTLRTDAWQAWQTGLGSGADATVSLAATGAAKPTLVVARVKGQLGTP